LELKQACLNNARSSEVRVCNLIVKDETSIWLSDTTDYSSGYLHSKEKFQYGKIEITCKLPSAKGLYPSFWMFSGSGNGSGESDEIDIFEYCTATPTPHKIATNIHGCYGADGEPIDECNDSQQVELGGFDFRNNWFTMGVNWSPYKVEWYIDILDGNGPQIVRTFPKY
jgi:beta-glucanase (GH16 family)